MKPKVMKKKVMKHLKKDAQELKKARKEDLTLAKVLSTVKDGAEKARSKKKSDAAKAPKTKAGKEKKIDKVMHEFKEGELKSGSKKGPRVTKRKQAVAIALSEAGVAKKKSRKK